MIDKEISKLQQSINELPSAPKEGSLVNLNEVLERLADPEGYYMNDKDAAYHTPYSEDDSWARNVKQMIESLITMPEKQRLKVLEEMPEYQKLLKFVLLVRDGRLDSHNAVQNFLDNLEPLLHEFASEAFNKLGHDGINKAYEELKQKKEEENVKTIT